MVFEPPITPSKRPKNRLFWAVLLFTFTAVLVIGGTVYHRWRQHGLDEELLNECYSDDGGDYRVKELLDLGANPNGRGEIDSKHAKATPLEYAALFGRRKTVDLLLERGANPKELDSNGNPVLFDAAWDYEGGLATFQKLVARGADIHVLNTKGENLLMAAAGSGNVVLIQHLIKQGFDVNARSLQGKCALDLTEEQSTAWAARFLVHNGARTTTAIVGGFVAPQIPGWKRITAAHPNGDASVEYEIYNGAVRKIGFYVLGAGHVVNPMTFIPGENKARTAIVFPFVMGTQDRLSHGAESRMTIAGASARLRTDRVKLGRQPYDIRVAWFKSGSRTCFLTCVVNADDDIDWRRQEADLGWKTVVKDLTPVIHSSPKKP